MSQRLSDEELEQHLGPAFVMLLERFMLVLAFMGVFAAVWFVSTAGFQLANLSGAFFSLIALAGLRLIHQGHLFRGLQLFLWMAWALVSVWVCIVMGVRTPIVMAYPLLITMTGWLISRNLAIVMAIVTIMLCGVMYGLEALGYFHIHVWRGPQSYFITIMVAAILAAIFAGFLGEGFRHQLQRVYDLTNELKAQLEALHGSRLQVEELNQNLEKRVEERTRELEETLSSLRSTQGELVQYEKMASLGAMVAGVSHELNTPIGNSLTAASALANEVGVLKEAVASGTLSRTRMMEFLDTAEQISDILVRSCKRSTGLISSFKQIAADQTSERRREFDLHELVEDIVSSLRPGIKTRSIEILMNVPDGLHCDSYPGPLGQILSNLLQNAFVHAFEETDSGAITITAARRSGGRISLRVSDNGRGMDSVTLAKIFDPFFTTRLGRGGTGLGLSVSHRIATEILGGNLMVDSRAGEGSDFTLVFPAEAPERI